MGCCPSLPEYTPLRGSRILDGSADPESGLGAIHRHLDHADLITKVHDDATTLYHNFVRGCTVSRNSAFLGRRTVDAEGKPSEFVWQTYTQVQEQADAIGAAIVHLDLSPEYLDDEMRAQGFEAPMRTIGIYSGNVPEWVIVEQACNAYNRTTVPLYATLGEDVIRYILKQTGMTTVFCSADKLDHLLAAKTTVPDGGAPEDVVNFQHIVQYERATDEAKTRALAAGITLHDFFEVLSVGSANPQPHQPPTPDSLATLCYTSGTTGNPKGVMLTHGNIIADAASVSAHGATFGPDDAHISYLPLAHVFERLVQVAIIGGGGRIGFWRGSPLKLLEDLAVLRPTIWPSVPRLFNRIFDKITGGAKAKGGLAWKLFSNGLETKKRNMREHNVTTHGFYDKIVFSKIQKRVGLDRCRIIITGSAPIAPHVMEFLRVVFSCSNVIEGYGQTECSAGCNLTQVGQHAILGHVGGPLACNEVRLVDVADMGYLTTDTKHGEGPSAVECMGRGEVCVRGPNVFKGYFKLPAKTAEALDADGWLHTGDVGMWTPLGHLRIVDRKKNIFKLSQGEYVAPEKIENVYTRSHFIQQIYVHGDSLQSCLVAVVVPDPDALQAWARANETSGTAAELCARPEVKAAIMVDMKAMGVLGKLKGFEKVRALHLDPEAWTPESGLMTPSMKSKRPQLKVFYQDAIDAMYASGIGVVAGQSGLRQGATDGAAAGAGSGAGAGAASGAASSGADTGVDKDDVEVETRAAEPAA